jgi:two-component system OmpR family response regulator
MKIEKRIRVLYVEDDPDATLMLKVMLAIAEIDLESASSVGGAIERAFSERFDLYLLDAGLPDGNGFSLCRTLRAADPEIPVLFYSGNAHPSEIESGLAAGASGYIAKPHSDKLAATITQIVEDRDRSGFAFLPVLAEAA